MSNPDFFATVIDQLREYDIALDERGQRGAYASILDEAHLRLRQLEYLLHGIHALVEERFRLTERPLKIEKLLRGFAEALNEEPPSPPEPRNMWTSEELARRADLAFEAELFADSFYRIAWRLREIVQRLPGLKKFDAEGIRTVRNHILEHPEKHLRTTPGRDLMLSRREGVILRPETANAEGVSLDTGLISNATQLRDQLASALQRARESLSV